MTDTIAGLPFWQLAFDEHGDIDPGAAAGMISEAEEQQLTDLVMFSHGWNNNRSIAQSLYSGWFSLLAPQLASATGTVKVGLVGVFWPSQIWSDEPIPDFTPTAAAVSESGGGAAALQEGSAPIHYSGPQLDEHTLSDLRLTYPAAKPHLDRMAALLDGPETKATIDAFMTELKAFAATTAVAGDDGETNHDAPATQGPPMLAENAEVLFRRFNVALQDSGVALPDAGGGEAGLRDTLSGLWNGAKEVLRQTTYWQMKNRAGTVGQSGLGPFIARLHTTIPELRVHLVGHSFGARLVSYALAGLPDPGAGQTSPIKSVTLLQGAFSHFAFADPLPFDASRKGALAGRLTHVDGPLTICFSSHDNAVGRFYPLASIASGEDSAAADDMLYRWGAMGHDGAQGVNAKLDILQSAGPDAVYRFTPGQALNIDASEIVCRGNSPSGAHSDIVHPELTWVVLKAGRILP